MFGSHVPGTHLARLFLAKQDDAPRSFGKTLPHNWIEKLSLSLSGKVLMLLSVRLSTRP